MTTKAEEDKIYAEICAQMNAPLTPEQERLYAEACALAGNERIAFIKANGLDYARLSQRQTTHKNKRRPQRSSKQQRKVAVVAQKGICELCEEELTTDSKRRIDHATGKILHVGCQLYIARTRKMLADGITLDRIAEFLQILRPARPLDPFSPDAPEL